LCRDQRILTRPHGPLVHRTPRVPIAALSDANDLGSRPIRYPPAAGATAVRAGVDGSDIRRHVAPPSARHAQAWTRQLRQDQYAHAVIARADFSGLHARYPHRPLALMRSGVGSRRLALALSTRV